MNQRRSMLLGGGIAVAVMLVIGLVVALIVSPGSGSGDVATPESTGIAEPAETTEPAATAEPTEAASTVSAGDFARNDPDDPMAKGDIDAPVVMIEWSDLRCYYCALFANETLPGLVSDYVDAGLLRIEWRSAVVLGDTSADAAIAVRAAARQDLFWEYMAAVYATEPTGQTVFDRDALVALAGQIPGLDVAQFTADLDDPELIAEAEAEAAQSQAAGVTGTPMFVVGDQVVSGTQPLKTFARLIDAQLP